MEFDVVIIGGGLAGLALATGLRRSSLSVALVETRMPVFGDALDARIYAISPANAGFLDAMGIWSHLDRRRLEPITAMEIFGDGSGKLEFSAYGSGVPELAWIAESSVLQRELWETARRQGNVTLVCPARPVRLALQGERAELELDDGRCLHAGLIVAADGADSWTRSAAGIKVDFSPYHQLGVVANFSTDLPHRGTAFQWFREDGILAWLPLPGNAMSMVWSTPVEHGQALLALSSADLCRRVAAAGGNRLGEFRLLTPAAGFPLRLMRAPKTVLPRLALIGDAAHTIHPLSGHGINLGFQDAQALAGVLCAKPAHEGCGDLAVLRRYERARKEEVLALQTVTDGLHKLFGQSSETVGQLRNFGLNFTNTLPALKDMLVRYALTS